MTTTPGSLRAVVLATIVTITAFQSCTSTNEPPELEVSKDPTPAAVEAPPTDQVTRLDEITGDEGPLAASVRDVRLMLLAEIAEARGDMPAATKLWYESLAVAQGKFGKRALDGWIKAYTKALDKKSDRLVLARLLLAEAKGGTHSPYMISKALTSDTALLKVLEDAAPEWLVPDASAPPPGTFAPPTSPSFPPDDPMLVKTTLKNCAAIQLSVDAWKTWLGSFNEDVRAYWQALIQQCAGQGEEALATFKSIYPRLAKDSATHNLALESISRVAGLERALDRKAAASETYLEVMKAWELPGLTADSLGTDALGLALRRIDETLWASRYRALMGDFENGKVYAQLALTHVANAFTLKAAIPSNVREQLATLRAEAYHVLAYRIAVEQRQFDSALSLNLLALQTPGLNREWIERLSWFAGLYDYLGGNFALAKKKWEALLAQTKDDSLRAMIYFWLAKSYDQLDQDAESRFYLGAIADDYPLSFYATIAPHVADFDGARDWRQTFGDPRDLHRRLESSTDFGLDPLRRTAALGVPLMRAEIMVAAKLGYWANLAVDVLEETLTSALPLESQVGAFVYLSRLHYNNGSFLKAIALTTKIAKASPGFWRAWPEQILIYYPRPYGDDYARNAQENGLDKALLLGISRQESGFTPTARSGANAFGVMQLIKPTASRVAGELGMDIANLDELLRTPASNIRMGSRYLKILTTTYKGYEPAIFGGYNAGEWSVDLWLKRRAHSDPLMFVELVPFGETKDYIKNVWRNIAVYRYLDGQDRGSYRTSTPGKDRRLEDRWTR